MIRRGGRRNNLGCESNVERLIEAWRRARQPLVFVRHDSAEPGSPLARGTAGNAFKSCVTGDPDLLVSKAVHSAFYGVPDLHSWLQANAVQRVVICGIQTNMCCETTARMASDLGYTTTLALDATHAFDRIDTDGRLVTADELARMTATNLRGEFAEIQPSRALAERIGVSDR